MLSDVFPFGEYNLTLLFLLNYHKLDKEENWNNPNALYDLTRYFEILVYYDYYYAFTCMNISEYDSTKYNNDFE